MFKEEWRENIDFAKKRQVVLFPLLLALVTTITTIGLQFLVGDSAAQSSEMDEKSFTWDQLRFALHLPLLMFSLGMGTFAFRGREAISQRDGNKNHLIAAIGLENMVIAHSPDATLVCHKDHAHKLKQLLELIEKNTDQKFL